MGLFTKKKETKEFEIEKVESRLDVLKAEKELYKDFTEELEKDLKDFAVANDLIDEDTIELIPILKKYGKKLDNFTELAYKSAELEIEKVEVLEDNMIKIENDLDGLRKELANTNKILERVAKALEKK